MVPTSVLQLRFMFNFLQCDFAEAAHLSPLRFLQHRKKCSYISYRTLKRSAFEEQICLNNILVKSLDGNDKRTLQLRLLEYRQRGKDRSTYLNALSRLHDSLTSGKAGRPGTLKTAVVEVEP